jgi:hypothetical protein
MTMSDPKTNPDGGFAFDGAIAAARQITKVNRLSKHLAGLDAMAAARKGVGPGELAAIMGMRLSEIDPRRLDELYQSLIPDPR